MVTLDRARTAIRDIQVAGQSVGDWVLTEPLGAGGLGVTWLAEHKWRKTSLTHRVVVKFMIPPGLEEGSALESIPDDHYSQIHERAAEGFVDEARTLEQLHSDFIPKVLGYGRVAPPQGGPGVPWFAQEFIDGPTLHKLLRRDGPLDGGAWFDFAHDLLRALKETHERQVKHLDLKLDNVVVHDERAVLIDFGLAATGYDSEWGRDGRLSGTWGWFPPEHLDGVWGPEDVASSADIFKLGMLLYSAATGKHPLEPWEAHLINPVEND